MPRTTAIITLTRNHYHSDTRARPPSRTLIDPLTAFVEALPNGLLGAVDAAKKAADETKKLPAKAGRAAYVNQEDLAKANVPDPGAFGVAVIVAGLAGVEGPKA